MLTHFLSWIYLLIVTKAVLVLGSCPGPVGDTLCQAQTGSTGFCVPGQWTCLGTNIPCGCDFRPSAPTAPTASTVPPVSSGASTSLRPSTSSILPRTTTTGPMPTSTQTSQSTGPAPAPVKPCYSGPSHPIFIWAEWPDLGSPSQWEEYYATLLNFISRNCGNFSVRKLIMRVTNPNIVGLWDVSTTSTFYQSFLSKLPPNMELRMYPYVLDGKAQADWSSYGGVASSRPLEGVFKYTNAWNMFLASQGHSVRIQGIMLDGEEKAGFASELSLVPSYKRTYNVPLFGVSIGFDATGSMPQYPNTDEFILQVYDLYVVGAPRLTLVQMNVNESPSDYLSKIDSETLSSIVPKYTDPRLEFMWSVQAQSKTDCLYPLGSRCGSSDDFGMTSAQTFADFLDMVQSRYPQLAGKSQGIFQFSFVPTSWL